MGGKVRTMAQISCTGRLVRGRHRREAGNLYVLAGDPDHTDLLVLERLRRLDGAAQHTVRAGLRHPDVERHADDRVACPRASDRRKLDRQLAAQDWGRRLLTPPGRASSVLPA